MTGKNATPLVGWHPRADHVAWLKAEVKRRKVTRTALLDEILDYYRAQAERARVHVQKTGHTVRFVIEDVTRYEPRQEEAS